MRFVALKTEEQQARSMIFQHATCWCGSEPTGQVLRGHLAEHGIVAAQGLAKVKVLATAMQDTGSLHPLVRELGQRYLDHVARLDVEIAELDKRLRRPSKDDETAKLLQRMPGMGPITAPPRQSRPLRRRWRPDLQGIHPMKAALAARGICGGGSLVWIGHHADRQGWPLAPTRQPCAGWSLRRPSPTSSNLSARSSSSLNRHV